VSSIHSHCQVAQSQSHGTKLVKKYGCPNAREKIPTLIKQKSTSNWLNYLILKKGQYPIKQISISH